MHDLRPALRPGLAAAPDEDPRFLNVWDQLRISRQSLRIPRALFACVQVMDGSRSLRELQDMGIPADALADLVRHLDAALFLAGPQFDAALADPVREPSCIGC